MVHLPRFIAALCIALGTLPQVRGDACTYSCRLHDGRTAPCATSCLAPTDAPADMSLFQCAGVCQQVGEVVGSRPCFIECPPSPPPPPPRLAVATPPAASPAAASPTAASPAVASVGASSHQIVALVVFAVLVALVTGVAVLRGQADASTSSTTPEAAPSDIEVAMPQPKAIAFRSTNKKVKIVSVRQMPN